MEKNGHYFGGQNSREGLLKLKKLKSFDKFLVGSMKKYPALNFCLKKIKKNQ